jgi:hypothetical protein
MYFCRIQKTRFNKDGHGGVNSWHNFFSYEKSKNSFREKHKYPSLIERQLKRNRRQADCEHFRSENYPLHSLVFTREFSKSSCF